MLINKEADSTVWHSSRCRVYSLEIGQITSLNDMEICVQLFKSENADYVKSNLNT